MASIWLSFAVCRCVCARAFPQDKIEFFGDQFSIGINFSAALLVLLTSLPVITFHVVVFLGSRYVSRSRLTGLLDVLCVRARWAKIH